VGAANQESDRARTNGSAPRDHSTTVEYLSDARVAESKYSLVLLFGRTEGGLSTFEIGPDPLRLGRDPECHVQLDDRHVSRQHAEIGWSETRRQHYVADRNSRNGIRLNGCKVTREYLQPGDVLRVGETIFRYGLASQQAAEPRPIEPPFAGRSRSLQITVDKAHQMASLEAPVLILGETGTGKELVATALHRASGRTGRFVAINCAALPAHLVESELFGHEKGAFSGADSSRPGVFRAARAGTLFLDEVGELPPEVQPKLLRALETRSIRPVGAVAEAPVDVRVVAATNRDLAETARCGSFRLDLYARLAELVIQVDPLRDRPDDLEPLWHSLVAELGKGVTIQPSATAFEVMALHLWPLNVRELRQLVRSALLLKPHGGQLEMEDLPAAMRSPRAAASPPDLPGCSPARTSAPGNAPDRQQLHHLVEEFNGEVTKVAAFLGKDRRQIYRWLRRAHIDPKVYRRRRE
jgi:DNA-binding NtrC family response regulator